MKFIKKYTTKWHDTDATRIVRPTELLIYMQETSNAHLSSIGFNLDKLRDEKGLAFILSKTRVAIYAHLFENEDITVETFTSESRGYAFRRFYRILRGDEVIAAADTTWALVDINTKQLCKVDLIDFHFEHEEPIDIGTPPRFRVPHNDDMQNMGTRKIVYSDLDYNMHMNNTRYANMLCDFMDIEDVPKIKGISISYLHESAFGECVDVYRAFDGSKYSFRTVNQNGKTCIEAEVLI